jgi:tRNA(His) 5'-end guanylyltransferase
MQDSLGDRMKSYEMQEAGRRFIPTLPVYARIDGRAFSKFTKGMMRPFDPKFTHCMHETTKFLVEQTNASVGYTQSDEISLVWHSSDPKSDIFFAGRIQKMTSQLAALASVKFFEQAQRFWPEKTLNKMPTFDARVFMLPNQVEATNCFVWREWDATKNSIQMLAQSAYPHKQLQGKGRGQQLKMLEEKGINWAAMPVSFKRGTYFARRNYKIELDQWQLDKMPEEVRPKNGLVTRSKVVDIELPPITSVVNRVGVIFDAQEPEVNDE